MEEYGEGPVIASIERRGLGGEYDWTEIDRALPRGVALLKRKESDPSPVGVVFLECLGRVCEDQELLERIPNGHRTIAINELRTARRIDSRLVTPRLITLATKNQAIRAAVELVLTAYPNLCWLRGGEYRGSDNHTQVLSVFPRNGLVGDIKALDWAYKEYGGVLRRKPALYMARIADILMAVEKETLRVFSEHELDLCIAPMIDESYPRARKWVEENVAMVRLPTEPDEVSRARDLCISKCIHPDVLD